MGLAEFRHFLMQSDIKGSRSTVLQPLCWLLAILMSGIFGSLKANGPAWLIIGLAIGSGACLLMILTAYAYFAIKNPDALRSEKFTLSKMIIEKNLIGDNITGLTEVESNEIEPLSLPSSTEANS